MHNIHKWNSVSNLSGLKVILSSSTNGMSESPCQQFSAQQELLDQAEFKEN